MVKAPKVGEEGCNVDEELSYKNRAARQVFKLNWFTPTTPTRRLLHQCGWLSIRQLIFYHSAVAIFRTRESRLTVYLSQKLVTEHPYPTKLAKG